VFREGWNIGPGSLGRFQSFEYECVHNQKPHASNQKPMLGTKKNCAWNQKSCALNENFLCSKILNKNYMMLMESILG
jgi:hypothetical protein